MYVAVDGIVETLRCVPPAAFGPEEICTRLRGVLLDAGTLSPFVQFVPLRYTRNFINRDVLFELFFFC